MAVAHPTPQMIKSEAGYWSQFPSSYREEQVALICQWIAVGDSGIAIGGGGMGKSNLAHFVANRADSLLPYLSYDINEYCFLYFDANALPPVTTTNFYRGMLRILKQHSNVLQPDLRDEIRQILNQPVKDKDELDLYFDLRQIHDLFIAEGGKRLVWLFDRFDEACLKVEPSTLSSLRSLRDQGQLRGKLSYLLFSRQPLARLCDLHQIDEFHEIVAANTCWVRPMVRSDALWDIERRVHSFHVVLSCSELDRLYQFTGGLPAFNKQCATAIAFGAISLAETDQEIVSALLQRQEFRRICEEIWDDLKSAEQQSLKELLKSVHLPSQFDRDALTYLCASGLVMDRDGHLQIFSPIFADFIRQRS